jgi:hypothetical protein
MQETEDLIAQLISIHGEAGVCPTAESWRAIFALGETSPIHILNLLKFKKQVNSAGGPISGASAYRKYSSGVGAAFVRVGGQQVFFGRVGHMFAFGPANDWDAAVVTRYPSARALADMWLSREFVDAHSNRLDDVERSQVLVFEG